MSNLSSTPVWESDVSLELNRKVLETLSWLSSKEKKIDRETYQFALKALDMATRGLVDEDISDAIEMELFKEVEPSRTFIFSREGSLAVIKYLPFSARLFIYRDSVKKVMSFDSDMEAEVFLKKVYVALKRKGYTKFNWD